MSEDMATKLMSPGTSAKLPEIPEEATEQTPAHLSPPEGTILPRIPPELFDPDGVMGKPFVLPGYNGHAFRGDKIPDLKKLDAEQPQIGVEGHAFVFDLSNPEHLKYYEKIFHMAYNGTVKIGMDRVDMDPKTGKYTAFVRWAFVYAHMKKKLGGHRG